MLEKPWGRQNSLSQETVIQIKRYSRSFKGEKAGKEARSHYMQMKELASNLKDKEPLKVTEQRNDTKSLSWEALYMTVALSIICLFSLLALFSMILICNTSLMSHLLIRIGRPLVRNIIFLQLTRHTSRLAWNLGFKLHAF